MARNEQVAPIEHGIISATATTALEAGKGGIKSMFKSLFSGTIIGGALGVIAGAASGLGWTLLFGAGASTVIGAVLACAAAVGLAGAIAGTVLMFGPVGVTLVGLGTALGLVKGTDRGVERVSRERGAATELGAQVTAYQAQMQAVAQASNRSPAPAYANTAPSRVQVGNDNMQYDGRMVSPELAAAR